jgi:heat shock protein HtpX
MSDDLNSNGWPGDAGDILNPRFGSDTDGRPDSRAVGAGAGFCVAMRVTIPPSIAPLAQFSALAAFGGLTRLCSTHPPTRELVARLRAMAGNIR